LASAEMYHNTFTKHVRYVGYSVRSRWLSD